MSDSSADWEALTTGLGPGTGGPVPAAVVAMLRATSPMEADEAYWRIDNRVVVQGQLFEAAVPTARMVADALCRREATRDGFLRGVDLLVEVVNGESHHEEVSRGRPALGDACRRELRPYVPCFERMVERAEGPLLYGLLCLLDALETDRSRWAGVLDTVQVRRLGPEVGTWTAEFRDVDSSQSPDS
ncbi:hypothetical protein [Nocardioides flavescens]|uniref:Uncharacterized protein n=1 Tax=Nocardioides flavescens TaxID=2691959 RepID=A0A6L7F4A1_9ACTN|nr:hypothetical protein [Nocardioides flavescens]MXG92078.1 hypothetical protein [Nocardioides flavescens]